ncbi:MAG TPA: SGNH/GDSL hydrolase family protein [Anaeromyxobacteraceae bacterium]|nr:SGNH/GDSL hydrolase family protein [Anaeromyxobacteraceae bacterium]
MPSSSPVPAPQGMRQVWLRFLAFCLPLALGWAGLEWGLARVPNSFSVKRDGLRALSNEVDTVILGSSEAFFGISPHGLSGTAFNLSNSAQTPYYDYEIMKRVLPELPRLRRVIIQFDYVSLYAELYDHTDNWRQYGYYQEWHIPLQRPIDYWDVRLFSRVGLYKTLSALLEFGKGSRMNFAPCVDDRGWCQAADDWSSPGLGADDARRMLDGQQYNMHDTYLPANAAVLERLIAMLRGHGIEVAIVIMPVYPSYQTEMHNAKWERAQAIVEGLAHKYGARYLNFEHEPRLAEKDFNDVNHLSAHGANYFSEILDAALGPPAAEKVRSAPELSGSSGG